MRLSFPNGEHADVQFDSGELVIGGSAACRVSLPGAGLADRHASIRLDSQRGVLLSVLDRHAQVHVNARPVREFAMLRMGDVVSLNRVQVLIKPDRDDVIVSEIPADSRRLEGVASRTAASRVVLRGVGGSWFGRSVPLLDPVVIGSGSEAGVRIDDPDLGERHAQIELHGERVLLRDLGSEEGSVVNGVPVRDAVLHPGDQVAFGAQRFVLEAPGLPPRGATAPPPQAGAGMGTTQTLQAVRAPVTAEAAGPATRSHYGWLIVTALAIAAAIVAVLAYAPR